MALAVGESDVSVVSVSVHMEVVGRRGRAPTLDGVGVGGLGEVSKDVGRSTVGCGVRACSPFFGGVLKGFGKGREG